jgi:hypothetical protein
MSRRKKDRKKDRKKAHRQRHDRPHPSTPPVPSGRLVEFMALAGRAPCVVCASFPAGAAILWVPTATAQRKLGAGPNQERICVYPICPRCIDRGPASIAAAEAVILDDAARADAYRNN